MVTTSGVTPKCWKPNQRPVQAPHALEVLGRGRVDPSLPLHGLQEHGRHDVAVDSPVEGVEVAPGHVPEALGQGLKSLVLLGLAGGVQRGQRAPVEGPVGADHHVSAAAAPLAGQLQRTLVGLGPRVGEEHPPPERLAVADQAVEDSRHLGPDGRAEQVRHVQQGAGLGGQRVGDGRMRMAE